MTIGSIREALNHFFNPAAATKELHQELVSHRKKIQSLMADYEVLSKWNHEYVSTLGLLTDSMEALVWKKDKDHKYILANPLHCELFFGYSREQDCVQLVVGRTDIELINANFIDNGIKNTFAGLCIRSDQYVAERKQAYHFLEAGVIGGEEILMYLIKTPFFSDTGEFAGSIGIAWDMTPQSAFLITQLKRWIYSGKAAQLYHRDEVFCYTIEPKVKRCDIFNHICPAPDRGKECGFGPDCDVCSKGRAIDD